MKVNVVMDSISRAAGGLMDAERRLWQSFSATGEEISVFSLADEFSADDSKEWLPLLTKNFPAGWPSALGRSVQLRARLLAEPADVLYRAGLWRWPSHYALEWSRKYGKPEVIAPHGMLDPWAVKNSAWKKKLALFFYEREHLENAACIRALCELEADSFRAFGLKNPICIIPNGIDLPDLSKAQGAESKAPGTCHFAAGRKVLLYLGRIHPKKGLVNLLKAWAAIQTPDARRQTPEWVLAIAGWDQGGHEAELKRLCDELGLAWAERNAHSAQHAAEYATPYAPGTSRPISLLFTGPLFGPDKESAYANCDAFILPSFSEGLPMVVLEAWAHGKPVLMTPECNLPEGFAANAAIRIEPNAESITQGLLELFETPCSSLSALGANGLRLVSQQFTWPKVAADMKSVYEWMLGDGAKPGCMV